MPVGTLAYCPKIIWNGVTLTFVLPQLNPEPISRGVGGSNVSGAGTMVGYELRRDQLLKTTLRFYESLWPLIEPWLRWAQAGNTFSFYEDKNDNTSLHTCYLSKPKMTDDIQPKRDGTFPGMYNLDVELRDSTGVRFDYNIMGY